MLYQIERIRTRGGMDDLDDKTLGRIGREGHILQLADRVPMVFAYSEPDVGVLWTTPVSLIVQSFNGMVEVHTRRHIYCLRPVEAQAMPETVWDLEE